MTSDVRVHDLGWGKSSKPWTPLKCYFILLTIYKKAFLYGHLVQFMATSILKALDTGSMHQGGARGQNLGDLLFSLLYPDI